MAWYKTTPVQRTPKYNVASGTVANFETNLALPMKSVVANIVPIQDLHGYSKPWAAGAGKNKVESKLEHCGIGTAGVLVVSDSQPYDMQISKVKNGVTYTITTDENTLVGGFFTVYPTNGATTYDGQRVVSNSKTFTSPIDGYFAFRTSYGYATPQLEEGSTATSYEPYENVCPISGTDELTLKHDNDNMLSLPTFDFTIQGVRVYTNEDGNVVLNGTSTGGISSDNALWKDNLRFSLPKGHYYLSCNSFSTYGAVVVVKNTDTNATICQFNSNWQIDLTETTPMRIGIYIPENKTFDNFVCNFEASLDNITYDVPNRETYTFDLGQEILGGTADVVGGVGEKTYIKHEFSSSEIISDNYIVLNSSTNVWYWTQNNLTDISGIDSDAVHYCNVLKQDANAYNGGVANAFRILSGNRFYITLSADDYPTKADFRNAIDTLKPVMVLKKTTPTDFTFTGQPINSLLGVNNVWTDSGEVLDVEYAYMPTGNSGAYFPAGSV